MKKKIISALLCASMVATMVTGCGSTETEGSGESTGAETTESGTVAEESGDAAAEEGKVLNIYCWNEEFKSRLTDHYPG